jgi:hypothetical protein
VSKKIEERPSTKEIRNILTSNWPFSYLTDSEIDKLVDLPLSFYGDQDIVYRVHDNLQCCYLIVRGALFKKVPKKRNLRFQELLEVGALFGEQFLLLEEPSTEDISVDNSVCLLKIPNSILQFLIQSNRSFSMALARNIRNKRSLLVPMQNFSTELKRSASVGLIHFDNLVRIYKEIQPALHAQANSSILDFAAWSYALNRLPEDILHNHVYLLSTMRPTLLSGVLAVPVHTRSRRRSIWRLGNGKGLVLLRDTHTDLNDFVTNLCVHTIEARKIRRRIRSPELVRQISKAIKNNPDVESIQDLDVEIAGDLGADNWLDFRALFKNPYEALLNIIMHHEDYSLYVETDLHQYREDGFESWISGVRKGVEELLEEQNWREYEVDIISSNTFGVRYCLSAYLHKNKETILEWATERGLLKNYSDDCKREELLYAVLAKYFKEYPDFEEKLIKEDKACGIHTIAPEGFTGITVDIIETAKLQSDFMDPLLPNPKDTGKRLIVNIDYAFGKQAEHILGCLLLLFGQKVRSINVMGKAGAVVGKRGDILLADRVLMEPEEEVHLINSKGMSLDVLKGSGRDVHRGLVLTVQGTLMQNHSLLRYYFRFWNCVGLEMEGSFYARQIDKAMAAGLITKDVATRFAYFVSDLPLEKGEQLSKDMDPMEFIPPLYAITRSFLIPIFQSE